MKKKRKARSWWICKDDNEYGIFVPFRTKFQARMHKVKVTRNASGFWPLPAEVLKVREVLSKRGKK